MTYSVQVREVGLRDGLQSLAEIMPTDGEDRLARRRARRRSARDRGQLVCAAKATAAARRCRGGGAPCAGPAGAHRLGADPEPQRGGARPGARRARDEFRAVGQRGAQPRQCAALDRGIGRGFPPRRGAVPDRARGQAAAGRLRPRHRLWLHDRGCGRRGPGAPHRHRDRRGRRRRHHPRRHGRLWPAGRGRAPLPPGHGRCGAVAGRRAFPRHPRARPRQCAGRA